MSELNARTALVTGGSQGIGRAIAKALAAAGCRVLVNCAHNRENAERVAAEIRAAGGNAEPLLCDVSDEAAVEAVFDRLENAGGVDILINNARLDPWQRRPETFFRRAKKRHWGRIVNMASVRSFRPAEPDMIAYGVSKLGMHALTRAYAHNGAPFGITANTVCPGMVVTENINKRLTPEKYAEESAAIPLGRGATSEEIADAVLFAVRNGYVTGETININGGMYYAP